MRRHQVSRAVRHAGFNKNSQAVTDMLMNAIRQIRYYRKMRSYQIFGGLMNQRVWVRRSYTRPGRQNDQAFRDILNSAIYRAWRLGNSDPMVISHKSTPRPSKFTIFIQHIYLLAGMGKAIDHVQPFEREYLKMWRKMRRNKGL